jgi:hypothetical protein
MSSLSLHKVVEHISDSTDHYLFRHCLCRFRLTTSDGQTQRWELLLWPERRYGHRFP